MPFKSLGALVYYRSSVNQKVCTKKTCFIRKILENWGSEDLPQGKNFDLISSRALENALLQNRIHIVFISDLHTKKENLTPLPVMLFKEAACKKFCARRTIGLTTPIVQPTQIETTPTHLYSLNDQLIDNVWTAYTSFHKKPFCLQAGLLLFTLFFNDLPSCLKHSEVVVYADDTAILVPRKDRPLLENFLGVC